jgi:hypothetical protein
MKELAHRAFRLKKDIARNFVFDIQFRSPVSQMIRELFYKSEPHHRSPLKSPRLALC